jgi:hypothetical protein
VAPSQTLPVDYVQQNTHCNNPEHNHISPDRQVDASTCCLPEHTWFFAGQHHEAAGNDVIVRLAVKLMIGEIKDIYSDPEFPQFNGSRKTNRIIRDYLPKCEAALERTDLTPAQRVDLQAAVDDCKTMLASNKADNEETLAIEARMKDILVKIGEIDPPKSPQAHEVILEDLAKGVSDFLWKKYGPTGFSEIADKEGAKAINCITDMLKLLASVLT